MNDQVSIDASVKKKGGHPDAGQKEKALGTLLKKAMAVSKKAMASEDLALLEQAIGLWHEVLAISPNSPIARRHLAATEEKRQILQAALLWNESASLDKTQAAPEGGIDLSASILMDLRKAARSMGGPEANLKKQLLLWKKILEIAPNDEEALAEIEKLERLMAGRVGKEDEGKAKPASQPQAPEKSVKEKKTPPPVDGLLLGEGIAEISHDFVKPKSSEMIPISPFGEHERQEEPFVHFEPMEEPAGEEIPQNQFFFSNALVEEPGEETHRLPHEPAVADGGMPAGEISRGMGALGDPSFERDAPDEASLPAFDALNVPDAGFSFAVEGEGASTPPSDGEPAELSSTELPPIENLVSGMEIEGSGLDELPGLESAMAEGKTVDLASALIGTTQELSHFIADYLEPELKKEKPKRKRRLRPYRQISAGMILGTLGATGLIAACVALFLFAAQLRPMSGPSLKRLGYGILKVGYAMEFLKNRNSEIERITAQREVDFAALLIANKKYERAIRHCRKALEHSILDPTVRQEIHGKAETFLKQIHDRFVKLGRYYERRGWRYRRKALEFYKLAFSADPLDSELNLKIYDIEKRLH